MFDISNWPLAQQSGRHLKCQIGTKPERLLWRKFQMRPLRPRRALGFYANQVIANVLNLLLIQWESPFDGRSWHWLFHSIATLIESNDSFEAPCDSILEIVFAYHWDVDATNTPTITNIERKIEKTEENICHRLTTTAVNRFDDIYIYIFFLFCFVLFRLMRRESTSRVSVPGGFGVFQSSCKI